MKLKDKIKEKRIKEVALQLVSEEGIAGVKMKRIAKVAQLSPSMIYTYFDNKEDLLSQIFKDCIKKITKAMNGQRDENLPYKMQVFQEFKAIIDLKRDKSVEYNFFRNFLQSPYFKNYHQEILLEEIGKFILTLLAEGQTKMIIRDDVDTMLLAALLTGFTDKLQYMHQNCFIDLNKKAIIDQAFSIFWDGIRQ